MLEPIVGNEPRAIPESRGDAKNSLGTRLTRETESTSPFSNFRSNLKDFLTEKPVKVHGSGQSFLPDTSFGGGWKDNLRDFFHPLPASARRVTDGSLLVEWKPWYR